MKKIPYGGDYNPEQWTPEVWDEDMRLLKLADIDIVTINVFNWASIQKDEETYDFSGLDQIVEKVTKEGMNICMGTSTAVHPAWMAKNYPDVLRTEWNGMRRKFGGRHNSCPNSPAYQKYSALLAEKLAKRYQGQKNIIAWHVNNEYGGRCYCENCEKAFRTWLRRKYKKLEMLNHEWNTPFWGHTFYDWDEIVIPNALSEEFGENRTMFQGISLDYARFCSDSLLENYKAESAAIKKHIPDAMITTNLMGTYKFLDYQKWGEYMDFISYDNYPGNEESPAYIAMKHDLMRSLKQGKPFALMEQTPSVSNWLPNNSLKRPGVLRLWSYQAVAHGVDTVMYFQMRRSPGACEKYHGAVIDHVGNENTRVFREASELGKELVQLGDSVIGSRFQTKAAIIFDWDNWWAVEYSAGPNQNLKYLDEIYHYYEAFHQNHIPVDLIACKDDFTKYNIIVAPLLYMIKPGVAEALEEYVNCSGTLVTTFFSGYVNENDYVTVGGYPGELRKLLGIWVEEIDSLPQDKLNHFLYKGKQYPAGMLCDLLHPEGAGSIAVYEEDFYQGMPVLTCNEYGKGKAYYVATRSDIHFYSAFIKDVCMEAGVSPLIEMNDDRVSSGLEVTVREKDGTRLWFLLNHNDKTVQVKAPAAGKDLLSGHTYSSGDTIHMKAYGVEIISEMISQ
ncbi:MAG: beta-galactosidase [Anaerocolumna sp.]